MSLGGNPFKQRQVDVGFDQVDELEPHLFAQGPQRVFLANEAQLDGDLVEPGAFGLREARRFELTPIQ